jgi:aspartyl-tRNA(Asn)/glutamyl-tRNA(Gln) amidotransferase subunit B
VDSGVLNSTSSKQVLPLVLAQDRSPEEIVNDLGLAQVSDTAELEKAVREAIASNQPAVADFHAGKTTAINFLKGQVMKATRGKANPAVAEDLLKRFLAQ